MHTMYQLKEMLCEELEEYGNKSQLDMGDLDIVDKLAHAIKNIDKIIMAKEYDGMSGEGGMSREGGRSYRGGRGYGYSHRNGRGGRGGYSRRGYSEADHEELVDELRDIMEGADATMKKEFERFIKKIEQM